MVEMIRHLKVARDTVSTLMVRCDEHSMTPPAFTSGACSFGCAAG